MKGAFGFPSPIGELHFSIVDGSDDQIMRIVSVPYRGATFLNNYDKDYLHKNHRFRPLSGSYISQLWGMRQELLQLQQCFRPLSGSYISQLITKQQWSNFLKFPSPIGELHFSIEEYLLVEYCMQGFRPLSGSYISQLKDGKLLTATESFPSPIGELHFSIRRQICLEIMILSFRPLSGSYISQLRTPQSMWMRNRVSVPYRGATFLNETVLLQFSASGFRPLSGSYISQYIRNHCINTR